MLKVLKIKGPRTRSSKVQGQGKMDVSALERREEEREGSGWEKEFTVPSLFVLFGTSVD